MDADDRERSRGFHEKIAASSGVDGVSHGAVEAQALGNCLAIHRKSGAGDRASAERRLVDACASIDQTTTVAKEELLPGHQMMGKPARLRALQMRIRGHQ